MAQYVTIYSPPSQKHPEGEAVKHLLPNARDLVAHCGWTWKQGRARKFANGLEAITFCFNQRIRNMQIVCA